MKITKSELNKINRLTEGGEGIIYEYGNDILKIYKSNVNLDSKEKKVKALISKSLPPEVICPKELAYDAKNKFIGYVMPRADGDEIKCFTNKKYLKSYNITTQDLLQILTKIKAVVEELHKQNIIIGDLNDQNILVDKYRNIHFLDCDSWAIGGEKCEVIMDLYRDPLLKGDDFTVDTDTFALSVLIWKTLTRIHPYGGTLDPDIDIMERMQKGITVINNPDVKIPRTIKSWANLSPKLILSLDKIFENKSRELKDELEEMNRNLKYCGIDGEFYYGFFDKCPLCSSGARVLMKPVSQGMVGGLMLYPLLDDDMVKLILNEQLFISSKDRILDMDSHDYGQFIQGVRYYLMDIAGKKSLVEEYDDHFDFEVGQKYSIPKKYKTNIIVDKDQIYFLTNKDALAKLSVTPSGNQMTIIQHTGYDAYFAIEDGHHCIINKYDGKLIICVDGYNVELPYAYKVIGYGLHYDKVTDKWLVLLENSSGSFNTYILKKTMEYENDKLKYQGSLANICFSNGTIYIPLDNKFRGYNPSKQAFKDFDCGIVSPDSRLIKQKNSFLIVNDENIYKLGK